MNNDDLGPLPKVNPRRMLLETASQHIRETLLDLFMKYELTASEQMFILSQEMNRLSQACVAREHRDFAKTASETGTVRIVPKSVVPR